MNRLDWIDWAALAFLVALLTVMLVLDYVNGMEIQTVPPTGTTQTQNIVVNNEIYVDLTQNTSSILLEDPYLGAGCLYCPFYGNFWDFRYWGPSETHRAW